MGAVLLVAVVVVGVSALTVSLLEFSSPRETPPRVLLDAHVNNSTVEIIHTGGESVAVADLRMVVRTNGTQMSTGAPSVTGPDDAVLEAGETARYEVSGLSVGDRVRVWVIHRNRTALLVVTRIVDT